MVLAGGAGRRLGGDAKPTLTVAGRPMLARVLDAVADAQVRIVVGPPSLPLPQGVRRTREEPPGGGPVAGVAAGFAALAEGAATGLGYVALLAADLPFLDRQSVAALRGALAGSSADGAVYVDATGHRQWLCGVWRTAALTDRLARIGPRYDGLSMRRLLGPLNAIELVSARTERAPWYDCDTAEDLVRAEGWADEHAGRVE
ncbi:MAG TPA: NTP transferase domain-containing protein [Micromonosporaceae bacterium]